MAIFNILLDIAINPGYNSSMKCDYFRIIKPNGGDYMGQFVFIVLCVAVIVAGVRAMFNTPERKRQKWIRDFVGKTAEEEIYPVGGANSEIVSFGSDKVADGLGIDTHEAYKLLNSELSRRGLPHSAPQELQSKIDLRIKQDTERWKKQIHEYVDSVPADEMDDVLKRLDHEKEISRRFSVPKRISGVLLRDELYTRTDQYKAQKERDRIIEEDRARHEYLSFKIAGVTFKNGRRSRQTILRQINFRDPPYDRDPEIRLEKCDFEGEPAFSVYTGDEQVGYIGKQDIPEVLKRWDKYVGVAEFSVYGGGPGRNYGATVKLKFLK